MTINAQIPVIDVFAGPGGLGEGFSRFQTPAGNQPFQVCLSIEKDAFAYRTLLLRALFRLFGPDGAPQEYYDYVRNNEPTCGTNLIKLLSKYPEGRAALDEVHQLELSRATHDVTDELIRQALGPVSRRRSRPWILIGGPPCQAYSLVGRSRMLAKMGQAFYEDHRHTLYREYLRLIRKHRPTVFVMENVKGLLSSRLDSQRIIHRILHDLRHPEPGLRYELFPLTETDALFKTADEPASFLIPAEQYGVPQARHRVIILGVLAKDLSAVGRRPGHLKPADVAVPVSAVLGDLPRLRSGLSRKDNPETWLAAVRAARGADWLATARNNGLLKVGQRIDQALSGLQLPKADRGQQYLPCGNGRVGTDIQPPALRQWLMDPKLGGVLNHQARGHMPSDLHRYLFAACYAQERGASPRLQDFPEALQPHHRNVKRAIAEGLFNDRFRVQLWNAPSTTVTSHISKDGHYFIHPDPTQCRSLTVREAARLQTFTNGSQIYLAQTHPLVRAA